jgi:hypothetical protein
MSHKGHAASVAAPIAAALLTVAAVGCGTSGNHAGSPVATSTAAAKARHQLDDCFNKVGDTGLFSSSGRSRFTACMKNVVRPAKRAQFRHCIINAAESDKLWTRAGRSKFTNTSLPNCIDRAA